MEYRGCCSFAATIFLQMSTLSNRWSLIAPPVAAAVTRAHLWLFLEPGHRPRIGPARTIQVVVVLVAVFLQTAPHVAAGLVPSKSSCAHITISVVAGATRAAMVDMLVVICDAQSEFSKPIIILGYVNHSAMAKRSASCSPYCGLKL